MILVCAPACGVERRRRRQGGRDLPGAQAAPIVIATEGEPRFAGASRRLRCPRCTPRSPSCSLDGGRPPVLGGGRPPPPPPPGRGLRRPARGQQRRGIASLLRYATGVAPLDSYQVELGKVGTPSTVVDDLTAALTQGIEELTRPIGAIKHQAKTVTVGISRSDETLLEVPLVQAVLSAGVARDSLSYRRCARSSRSTPRSSRSPGSRATASRATSRATRPPSMWSTGAASPGATSLRTDTDPRLIGTKHRVATSARSRVAKGLLRRPHAHHRARGQGQPGGRALAAATCASRRRSPADVARAPGLPRAATPPSRTRSPRPSRRSTTPALADVDLVDLLTEPVYVLAERWRTLA